MSSSIWITLIGSAIILMACIEIITGVAAEKPSLVRRSKRPRTYWFSVIAKYIVGLSIIKIEYLRSLLQAYCLFRK